MWLAVSALVYLSGLCVLAVFHKAYRDNLPQQWGLVIAFFGFISLIPLVMKYQEIGIPCNLVLIGLSVFATGTLAKVVHFTRKRRNELPRPTQADPVS